ncbi:uncharacterized protein LOC121730722 [Aricia agestis]|uniref:uncharacterized protein LOC121730722 n=1 Tax=Aricia agestis TaxID=91739 RepID=UPI001C205CC1|nr:uncharacterized protein LOC121730722 [Aricia agestis]
MMALLAVCVVVSARHRTDSTADRPADRTGHRENGTFPHRSKYNKDRKAKSLKIIIKEALEKQKYLHRSWNWVETTDKNRRVITKAKGYKRSEMRVVVKNNWLKASGKSITARGHNMLTHSVPLPANAVVSAINATLTSDGYQVLDIPIDKRAPKSSQRERNVPIVESGKPMDSKHLNITHLYGDSSNSHTSLNIEKDWIKLENDHRPWHWIEATDKNMRVIIKVEGYKRSELRVRVKNNWVKASGNSATALVQMFIHTESLPANAVVSAINATLTSDGYLVVDIPIDKGAPKSSQRERNVPIVESGKPVDTRSKHLNIAQLYGYSSDSDTSWDTTSDISSDTTSDISSDTTSDISSDTTSDISSDTSSDISYSSRD